MGFTIVLVVLFVLFFVSGYFLRKNKVLVVIAAIIYAALVRTFVVQAFQIPAGSMMPTLFVGDHILTSKYAYLFEDPVRGDLVIFLYPKDPKKNYVKRVVAIGGDVLEIKEKKVFLNGELLVEPYVVHRDTRIMTSVYGPRDNFGPITIPEDSLFVLGDNRDESFDSRFWGFVAKEQVRARVEMIYWSWNKETAEARWDRVGELIR